MTKENLNIIDYSKIVTEVACEEIPWLSAIYSFRNKRAQLVKQKLGELDPDLLNAMSRDENFQHLIIQVTEASVRSKESEKALLFTKFFKTVVENGKFDEIQSDEIEEFIYIFSSLSFREILALHKIREFTLANKDNRTSEDNIYIEDLDEWNKVERFLINNLQVNGENVNGFLSRLGKSGLIIKNKNRKDGFSNWGDALGGSASSSDNSYISTYYFERSYTLSKDIEDYLNDSIK